MSRHLRLVAATAIAALAVTACSSDPEATPTDEPTTSEAPTTDEPTTEEPTPTEAPQTEEPTTEAADDGMTVEEAQEIVDTTTGVYNDAVTTMLTEQRMGQSFIRDLKNIYQDPMYDIVEAAWLNAASDRFSNYNTDDPTGLEDRVLELVSEQDDCFVVRIERDFRGLTDPESENTTDVSDRYFLAFERAEEGSDRDGGGSGWIRRWDIQSRESTPEDLCTRENPGLGDGA